jgi:hypothetical protein
MAASYKSPYKRIAIVGANNLPTGADELIKCRWVCRKVSNPADSNNNAVLCSRNVDNHICLKETGYEELTGFVFKTFAETGARHDGLARTNDGNAHGDHAMTTPSDLVDKALLWRPDIVFVFPDLITNSLSDVFDDSGAVESCRKGPNSSKDERDMWADLSQRVAKTGHGKYLVLSTVPSYRALGTAAQQLARQHPHDQRGAPREALQQNSLGEISFNEDVRKDGRLRCFRLHFSRCEFAGPQVTNCALRLTDVSVKEKVKKIVNFFSSGKEV